MPRVHRAWLLTFPLRCFWSPWSRLFTPWDRGFCFKVYPCRPTRSVSTGSPLVGYSYLLHTDGRMCREVNGLCLKLRYRTPGLGRTSAESAPDKGTTSPIPIEPLMLLLFLLFLLLLLIYFMLQIFLKIKTDQRNLN